MIEDFFMLLTVTSLDVSYCNFVNVYKDKNSYQDDNFPT